MLLHFQLLLGYPWTATSLWDWTNPTPSHDFQTSPPKLRATWWPFTGSPLPFRSGRFEIGCSTSCWWSCSVRFLWSHSSWLSLCGKSRLLAPIPLGSLCDLQLYLSKAAQPVCSQDAQMQSQCRILHFVRFLLAHFSSSSGLSELNLCYLKSWLLFLFQYHPLIFWGFTPSHCSSCQWRYWIILAPLWTPLPASNWMLSHPGLAFNSAVHQLYSPSHFSNLYLLSLPMRTLGKWILVVFSKNWTVIWSISGRFTRQIFETSLMKGSFT